MYQEKFVSTGIHKIHAFRKNVTFGDVDLYDGRESLYSPCLVRTVRATKMKIDRISRDSCKGNSNEASCGIHIDSPAYRKLMSAIMDNRNRYIPTAERLHENPKLHGSAFQSFIKSKSDNSANGSDKAGIVQPTSSSQDSGKNTACSPKRDRLYRSSLLNSGLSHQSPDNSMRKSTSRLTINTGRSSNSRGADSSAIGKAAAWQTRTCRRSVIIPVMADKTAPSYTSSITASIPTVGNTCKDVDLDTIDTPIDTELTIPLRFTNTNPCAAMLNRNILSRDNNGPWMHLAAHTSHKVANKDPLLNSQYLSKSDKERLRRILATLPEKDNGNRLTIAAIPLIEDIITESYHTDSVETSTVSDKGIEKGRNKSRTDRSATFDVVDYDDWLRCHIRNAPIWGDDGLIWFDPRFEYDIADTDVMRMPVIRRRSSAIDNAKNMFRTLINIKVK